MRVSSLRNAVGITLAAMLIATASASGAAEGGGGGGSGGGSGGETTGSLYSDLVVALRAENGTPILQRYDVPAEDPADPATAETCVQPVSYERVPGVAPSTNPVDGHQIWVIPLQGEWLTTPPEGGLPAEIEACDPQPQYAMFVAETELERLNMTRTSDDVLERKVAAVATKLLAGTEIVLDPAGRILIDGVPIDAAPEQAAIYDGILKTGTISGLPTQMAGPPAVVGPVSSEGLNSQFDAWELSAAAIGAAAHKETPITVDTVLYYNRIVGFPADGLEFPPGWIVDFNRSLDPVTGAELTEGEQFVDLSGFRYNRSETFPGSVTWLDVDTMTWQVHRIFDKVRFTNIPGEPVGDRTLTGVQAFAQMADDVRAAILFLHEHEVVPGFFMDRVGTDTTDAQLSRITNPAVSWGELPVDAFQTEPFTVSPSLYNPWGGQLVEHGRLRITIDAPTPLAVEDVAASSAGQNVPFSADADGDLVGWWGPAEGFPVDTGYKVTTPFDVNVADDAPDGDYALKLELVSVDDPTAALAADDAVLALHDNVPTALWDGVVPRLVTQGTAVKLPVEVYAPTPDPTAALTFSIAGPGDDPSTETVVEALKAGDISIYGEAPTGGGATDMVRMPLTLVDGRLVGQWPVALAAGFTQVQWYMTAAEGALEGGYHVEVGLLGHAGIIEAELIVTAPEEHGQKPPGKGDEPPAVVIETEGTLGASATFLLLTEVAEEDVSFECQLTVDSVAGPWTDCTTADGGRAAYQNLRPAKYTFAARATDRQGNTSPTAQVRWTVSADTTPQGTPSPTGTPDTAATPDTTSQPAQSPSASPPAPTVTARVRTHVQGTLYRRYLNRDRVQFYGSVLPRHDGAEVLLQRRTTAGYRTVSRITLRRATQRRSEYRRTFRHAKAGRYRIVVPGDEDHLTTTIGTVRVRAR